MADISSSPSRDVAALLLARSAAHPDAGALETADGQTISYRHLHERVDLLANSLTAAIAVKAAARPRIGIVLPNGVTMAVSLLAASCAGIAIPFNPALTPGEFAVYFRKTGIDALLTGAAYRGPAAEAAGQLGIPLLGVSEGGTLAGKPQSGGGRVFSRPKPDDIALVLLTSGSTGRAKAVPLTHRNICTSASQVCASLELGGDDRCLTMWEQYHVGGLVDLLLAPLMAGGTIICTPGFAAPVFYRLLTAARPTWFQGVPTVLGELVFHASRHAVSPRPNTLRFIRSVAAPLQPRLMGEVEALFAVPVIQTFGMTEAGPLITSTRLPPLKRKPGSTGQSLGTQIRIVGPDGAACPATVAGEIAIRGDNVFPGYENDQAANRAQFRDGWFHTGDIGFLDVEGDLFLTGRIKQLINRGGEKINPQEVDDALLSIPAVSEAAAFAVSHPTLGEDVAAAVVLRSGDETDEAEIRGVLKERLAPFKIPRRVIFLERLPRNAIGKIDRLALSAEAGRASGDAHAPPRNALERFIAEVWGTELGVGRVGIDDDFAGLGGDSLSSLRIIMALEAALRVDILGDTAAESATVRALARRLVELGCDVDGTWASPGDGRPSA